ncbi:uncharacterized protein LOC132472169 [Gadus macrocephalus]|uniref:uncharacterized protein LOC132472169 n=1 Tax=Gadus macrocephalus TaxID=80720 RepID=UPI0028CB153E|nr:uncharacterized protein LOC132472169 [Gadus macrocephalus]
MTFPIRRYIYAMLLAASSAAAGKYVAVQEALTWHAAESYCRNNFIEFASFSSSKDMDEIHKAVQGITEREFWVGLYREETNEEQWRWSRGGNATGLRWANYHPSSSKHKAALRLNVQNDNYCLVSRMGAENKYFLCRNWVVVVTERRTWEEALEYCREKHDDLASLASERDLRVASREISEAEIDERVWVGLRHFGARWMWLKGELLGSNASLRMSLQGQPCSTCETQQCYTCGSLSPSGELQGRDCKTELQFLCY